MAKATARRRRRGGFVVGAVAGAVAGLLLAPRSGKETRAQLLGGFVVVVNYTSLRSRKLIGVGDDSRQHGIEI